jgi:hypothetical protein
MLSLDDSPHHPIRYHSGIAPRSAYGQSSPANVPDKSKMLGKPPSTDTARREALVVWVKLLGLLILVGIFGYVIFRLTVALR